MPPKGGTNIKPLKVLSLFDGISCGMVALERAKIPVERYVAYEIDKYAIQVSKKNYPDIEHMGDVTTADFSQYKGFDLLIGGSPCQGFSFAGKQLNFNDPRSKLFFEFVRAIEQVNPKYFLLENVKMKKEYQDVISRCLGVEPVLIDSSDFSAQIRKRLYWTNIPFSNNYNKSPVVFKDIEYQHKYKIFDFSQYANTFKTSIDGMCVKWDTSGKGYYSQQSRARSKNSKMNTVPAGGTDKNNIYLGNYTYRKLHPIEAERLQCLPDNYTSCLSAVGKRIGVCGNGWTVDVIVHILRGLSNT